MSNKEIDYKFTAVPNFILDKVMPKIDGNSYKVMSLITRNTAGYHKIWDEIALSQFENYTGLSRNTIIKSLKMLSDKQYIEKNDNGITNSYRLIFPKEEKFDSHLNKSTSKSYSAKVEPLSSNIEHDKVHKMNPYPVQYLNTQKKPIKENEINSNTTIKEGDFKKVVHAWNSKFKISVSPTDDNMIKHINDRLNDLSSQEIIQAMDNRLGANYYKDKKPELLHRPSCFFPYLDTIKSDLQRTPDNLYTYDEQVKLITEKGYHGDAFVIRRDKSDADGRPMWELKSSASDT